MGTPHKIDGIDVGRALWTAHGATQEAAIAHAKLFVPPGRVVSIVLRDPRVAAEKGDAAVLPAAFVTVVPGQQCMVCSGIAPGAPARDDLITHMMVLVGAKEIFALLPGATQQAAEDAARRVFHAMHSAIDHTR